MLLLKSAIISSAFLLFSASPYTNTVQTSNQEEEYCYELTLNVTFSTPVGPMNTTTVASGCGATPQEGLNELGEAVRALANQR
jgi:hypothetical protein